MDLTSNHNPKDKVPAKQPSSKAEDAGQTDNKDEQEQWRKAYILQLRRRNCPGCGDGDEVF
jgi:hypothetical protein